MHLLLMKNRANSAMYIVQGARITHFFYKHLVRSHLKFHYEAFYFHQYFQDIPQLIYQLICFYIYNIYNLDILQHHMIYDIHTLNCCDSK